MDTVDPNRHKELVNAALELNRHLWKLRLKFGLTVAEVLCRRSSPDDDVTTTHQIMQVRDLMKTLRKVWPRLSDVEIIDLTMTITQAASATLSHELQKPKTEQKPTVPERPKRGRPKPIVEDIQGAVLNRMLREAKAKKNAVHR